MKQEFTRATMSDFFDAKESFGLVQIQGKRTICLKNKQSSRMVPSSFHAGKWCEKDMTALRSI